MRGKFGGNQNQGRCGKRRASLLDCYLRIRLS